MGVLKKIQQMQNVGKKKPEDDPLYDSFSQLASLKDKEIIVALLKKMYGASDHETEKVGGVISKFIAKLKNKRGVDFDAESVQKSGEESLSPEREKKLEFIKSQYITTPTDPIAPKYEK